MAIVIKRDEDVDTNDTPELTPEQLEQLKEKESKDKEVVDDKDESTQESKDDLKPDIVSINDREYILDEEGNALKPDGTVFKTKEELESGEEDVSDEGSDAETLVEIEGTQYKLNDKGDAIDDKGKVKFTKEELDSMEEEDINDTGIDVSTIIDTTAIKPVDDEGNNIEYSNDEAGVTQYVNDVYEVAKNDSITELYNAYPELQNLQLHLDSGGSIDNFTAQVDYSKVQLDKKNEDQLKNIIYKARSARGDRPEQIDRYYNSLKAGDKDLDNVYEEAEVELEYLNNKTKEEVKAKQDLIDSQAANKQKDIDKYWGVTVSNGEIQDLGVDGSVYSIIQSGKFTVDGTEYNIPDKVRVIENNKPKLYDKKDIFDYVFTPITVNVNGRRVQATRHQLDLAKETENRTVGHDLLDAIKRFTHYDFSQFVKEQVDKDKVKTIKKLKVKKGFSKGNKQVNTKKPKVIIKRR